VAREKSVLQRLKPPVFCEIYVVAEATTYKYSRFRETPWCGSQQQQRRQNQKQRPHGSMKLNAPRQIQRQRDKSPQRKETAKPEAMAARFDEPEPAATKAAG
jgi:hypothetical protein